MALFKILRGQRINLKDHAITDGYAYVTLDEHNMYIDSGTDTRFKLGDKESTPFIVGTQTTATNRWTGNASSIDTLFDGLTIKYQLPYLSSGDVTLELTLSDGTTTGEIECYFNNIFRLNIRYPAGTIVTLTYRKTVSISGTVYTGWWVNNSGFIGMDSSGHVSTSVGGSHKPVYLSNGVFKQVDFSLDNVLDGTPNTLAYYSRTDQISSNPDIFIHSDKIAIGTDTSDYNLYVKGNSYITSNLSIGTYNNNYNLYVEGPSKLTGLVTLAANQNADNYTGALDANKSNIYRVNALFFVGSVKGTTPSIPTPNTPSSGPGGGGGSSTPGPTPNTPGSGGGSSSTPGSGSTPTTPGSAVAQSLDYIESKNNNVQTTYMLNGRAVTTVTNGSSSGSGTSLPSVGPGGDTPGGNVPGGSDIPGSTIVEPTFDSTNGLQWYRTSTTVDSLWVNHGIIYFTPNRTLGTSGLDFIVPFGSKSGVGTNGLSILQLNPNGALVTSNKNEGDVSTPLYLKNGVLTTVKHPTAENWFTGVPVVYPDGVTALGRYLDFHPEGTSTLDYHVRLDTGDNTTQRIFTFGAVGGELVTHAADTRIGDTNLPIYINSEGTALPLTTNIGSGGKTIVYFNNGAITASTATEGGSAHPIYLKDGVLTGLSGNVGDINTPVYIDNGTIKSTGKTFTAIVPSGDSSDTTFPSSKAVWTAIANGITANDAMVFKGTIGLGGTVTELPEIHYSGWTYRVISVGYYAGQICEVGDLIICLTDGVVDDDSHWTVAQSNIDGAVVTPSSNRTVGGTARPVYINNGVATQIDYTIGASIPQGMATQMLYYDTVNSLKTISTANGALYATAENGTPIWGTLPVAQGGTGAVEPFIARQNLGFNTLIANTTTNSGWHMIEPTFSTTDSHNGFILKSIRTQQYAPEWIFSNYAAGIAFGGGDTKGVLSVPYAPDTAGLRIAGGNSNTPRWYFTISATSGRNYIMSTSTGYIPTSPNRQAGGTEQPVYVDSNGILRNTNYALKATINNGTSRRLAFYDSDRSIAASGNLSYDIQSSTSATPATLTILRLWGQTYGNDANYLLSKTAGVLQYGDGGPQIQFSTTAQNSQSGALIFTDHDNAGAGVSWHFVSNQTDWNVNSKRFVAKSSVSIGTNKPNTDYSLFVNGDSKLNGPLYIQSNKNGYREGIRIYPYQNWSAITLLGADAPGISGITANSWFIGNSNGRFYLTRAGSSGANPVQLSCVNNIWSFTGTVFFKSNAHLESNVPGLYIRDMSNTANSYATIYFGNVNTNSAAYIWLNGPQTTSDGGPNTFTIKNKVGNIRLDNDISVSGNVNINGDKAISFAEPTGRLQSQGSLYINADTSNSKTQYVIITSGHGVSSDKADGLAIGAESLKWKNVDVVRNTGTWNISVTGSAGSLSHRDFTRSLQLTTEWMDTGIVGSNLATGTYIIQIFCNKYTDGALLYSQRYSGVMSWYQSTTNSTETDEIPLHEAGHASNKQRLFLRTMKTAHTSGVGLKLQIASSVPWTAPGDITFKFALVISG